nr:hypothetical protein [Microbacterium halimionae]
MMAGAGNAWERRSRLRHRRRLEVIKAKGELKAAHSQVPAAGAVAAGQTADEDIVRAQSQKERMARVLAAHDAVIKKWLEYELDVAKVIAYPAMSDGRQPLTAAFLRAKKVADNLRPESDTAKLTPELFAEYRDAVTDCEVAFDVAERDARRLKDASFTPVERKRLDTAQQLLAVAIDQAATPAERQLAYKRVRQELDGLISLSDDAIDALEKRVAHEIASPQRESSHPPASPPPPTT